MFRLKRNFAHIKQGAFIKLKRYLLRMELGSMTWRKKLRLEVLLYSHIERLQAKMIWILFYEKIQSISCFDNVLFDRTTFLKA